MVGGFRRPKNPILGSDFAGRVEVVGKNVTQFYAGDEDFASQGALAGGGFAQYVCVEERALQQKPSGGSFAAAATVPLAGVAALQALRDTGEVQCVYCDPPLPLVAHLVRKCYSTRSDRFLPGEIFCALEPS
jgi:NADPH:quinone reductase-like Zn-dependent oxidoreductase